MLSCPRVVLLDTETGVKVEVPNKVSIFDWVDNNWSCDCNRANYFNEEVYDEINERKPEGYCWGCERFLVVACDDPEYTLQELNAGYPPELLAKFGITS